MPCAILVRLAFLSPTKAKDLKFRSHSNPADGGFSPGSSGGSIRKAGPGTAASFLRSTADFISSAMASAASSMSVTRASRGASPAGHWCAGGNRPLAGSIPHPALLVILASGLPRRNQPIRCQPWGKVRVQRLGDGQRRHGAPVPAASQPYQAHPPQKLPGK